MFALFARRASFLSIEDLRSPITILGAPTSTMSRIEELPDDFDNSINLNHASPKVAKEPPAAATAQSSSHEDLDDYLRKSPLFMTDINNAGDESMSELLMRSDQYG